MGMYKASIQPANTDTRNQCYTQSLELPALDDRYCMPTFKFGRVTIMIWACFSVDRIGHLNFEEGGIGGHEYDIFLMDFFL